MATHWNKIEKAEPHSVVLLILPYPLWVVQQEDGHLWEVGGLKYVYLGNLRTGKGVLMLIETIV